MDKRVYGVIGIKSVMSNWNADFTGSPKSISTGEVFGSDKAFKYPMKKVWENNGEKILYIKSLKKEEDKKKGIKIVPRTLKERYEKIFDVANLKDEKDPQVVLTNLFKALDVKQFGATFAEESFNFSITGAVQIGQGFNRYVDTATEVQQILSPFKDPKKEDAEQSTLGTKIMSNEAHYFYPFVINPHAYDDFVALGVTEGYTEEDYQTFKDMSLISATAFNTNAKMGCENEFGLFIETESKTYLPELSQYIVFEKQEGKDVVTVEVVSLLEGMKDRVLSVEIYYNPLKMEISNLIDFKQRIGNVKVFNIFTKEEISL